MRAGGFQLMRDSWCCRTPMPRQQPRQKSSGCRSSALARSVYAHCKHTLPSSCFICQINCNLGPCKRLCCQCCENPVPCMKILFNLGSHMWCHSVRTCLPHLHSMRMLVTTVTTLEQLLEYLRCVDGGRCIPGRFPAQKSTITAESDFRY